MSARVFVDTNVWVYAEDAAEPLKRARAREVVRLALASGAATVSSQVLGEYFVTMRRLFSSELDDATAERRVAAVADSCHVVAIDSATVAEAIRGVRRHGLSFWDAQIWSAAKRADAHVLLTEDFSAGRELEGVLFVDPFADGFDLAGFAETLRLT